MTYFLSFRGEDTRDSFTDHLYDALMRAGIDTFKDNEEINKGEELKPEIERAIKESRASILVLSENYATSAWCLDELCLILEQRLECNHFVLPIFYHINPSDIRKQSEILMIQVDAHPRWAYYNMTRWKIALKEVADLAGMGYKIKIMRSISCPKNLVLKAIYEMRGSAQIKLANNHIDNSIYMKIPGVIISKNNESEYSLQLKEYLLQYIQIQKEEKITSVCQGKWPEFVTWRQEYQKMLMGDDKDLEHLKQQVSRYYAEISRFLRDAHDPHKVSSQGKVRGFAFVVCGLEGIESIVADTKDGRLIVIGDVDPVRVATCVRKIEMAEIITVGQVYNCADVLSKVASACSVM
ncbi:Toll/interleukin-1 receptor-like protein [Tanacetum coccineum]